MSFETPSQLLQCFGVLVIHRSYPEGGKLLAKSFNEILKQYGLESEYDETINDRLHFHNKICQNKQL